MAASGSSREFPVIGKLIERMKRFSSRSAALSELRRMDDRQVGQVAHEFGLSRAELITLCAKDTSGELLKQRLAEFGFTEEMLAKRHPEVLQDLQRVCGTCTTTSRCAHDFAAHRDSGRDEYCPNTCTLYALKQEGLGRKDGSCCGSCS
jgi:uncharacterized protein YjiS (DUF1127 family)